jgi:hypothetical protein
MAGLEPAKRPLVVPGGFLAALLLSAAASAATITVTFTGTVSFVATDLASGFTVGDPVSGTFQYDSEAADTVPANPMLGFYPGATGFTFDFGGYLATGDAPGSAVQVDNDAMAPACSIASSPARRAAPVPARTSAHSRSRTSRSCCRARRPSSRTTRCRPSWSSPTSRSAAPASSSRTG